MRRRVRSWPRARSRTSSRAPTGSRRTATPPTRSARTRSRCWRSTTGSPPNPMMPVANRPVLHHLLNLLRRHDVREVGINLHVFPEMIQRYFDDGSALGMSIEWSYERELLGTAGGTKKLEGLWGREPILITSGDGL